MNKELKISELEIKELKKINKFTEENIQKISLGPSSEFSKEGKIMIMAKKYLKKCVSLLAHRKIQIKSALRFPLTLVRMAKINKTAYNKSW